MSGKVQFHFLKTARLPQRRLLRLFINDLFSAEGRKLDQLIYIFCSDEYLLSINQQFLQHDYYTDIITFDLSDDASIKGEIYISIDRVRDNALTHGESFNRELHRVIFHGALHLCGYKDKKKADKLKMTQKEDEYLEKYQYEVPRKTVSRGN